MCACNDMKDGQLRFHIGPCLLAWLVFISLFSMGILCVYHFVQMSSQHISNNHPYCFLPLPLILNHALGQNGFTLTLSLGYDNQDSLFHAHVCCCSCLYVINSSPQFIGITCLPPVLANYVFSHLSGSNPISDYCFTSFLACQPSCYIFNAMAQVTHASASAWQGASSKLPTCFGHNSHQHMLGMFEEF